MTIFYLSIQIAYVNGKIESSNLVMEIEMRMKARKIALAYTRRFENNNVKKIDLIFVTTIIGKFNLY